MRAEERELIELALASHGGRDHAPGDIRQQLLRLSTRRQGEWPDGLFHQLISACHGAFFGHGRPVPGALIGAAVTQFTREGGK